MSTFCSYVNLSLPHVKSLESTLQSVVNQLILSILRYPGTSWSWSYGNWIYNYLYNQYLSPLKLWVRTPFMTRYTRYNIMGWSLSETCGRSVVFSEYSGSSTNKIDHHDIAEILLKVALSTVKPIQAIQRKTYKSTLFSSPHLMWYLPFYYYVRVDTSTVGLLVSEGFIHLVVTASPLVLFIRYIWYRNWLFLNLVIIFKPNVSPVQSRYLHHTY